MGCNGSRRTISGMMNPYDLEAVNEKQLISFAEKSTPGLWTGKVCASTGKTPERPSSGVRYTWGKSGHSTDVPVMDQNKNKQMLERQTRELEALEAFKADAALNGAICNIHELRGTPQLEATRVDMNMKNIYAADDVFSGKFSPVIATQPIVNIPSCGVYEASDPYNANGTGTMVVTNPLLGYLPPGSPVYMGKKPEVEAPEMLLGSGRHTSNNASYSNPQREKQTSAEILEILESGYVSSKSTETSAIKNGEVSTDLNVEKKPSSTVSDFESFKTSYPFGLGGRSMSQMLQGSFSDDSDTLSNQERREGDTEMERIENENLEDIVNEINLKYSSSSSDSDFNTLIAETDANYK